MTNIAQNRQPKGAPTGGQFAATTQPAAGISLVEMDEAGLDEQDRQDLRKLNEYLSTLSSDDLEVAKDLLTPDWDDEDELEAYRGWAHFNPASADDVQKVAEKRISESGDDCFFELSRDIDGELTGWTVEIGLGGPLDAGLNTYTSFYQDKDGPSGFAGALTMAKRMDSIAGGLTELRDRLKCVVDAEQSTSGGHRRAVIRAAHPQHGR